jgi:hypothetical protein
MSCVHDIFWKIKPGSKTGQRSSSRDRCRRLLLLLLLRRSCCCDGAAAAPAAQQQHLEEGRDAQIDETTSISPVFI